MDLNFTDVIAVFDIGRTWKRFRLFDRSLNPVHTEERIIPEARDEQGLPCEDIPAITGWMDGCLRGVAGTSLYRFAGLNIAAGDDSLPKLEKALAAIVRSGIVGEALSAGRVSQHAASRFLTEGLR